jgi:hypothetical protein
MGEMAADRVGKACNYAEPLSVAKCLPLLGLSEKM